MALESYGNSFGKERMRIAPLLPCTVNYTPTMLRLACLLALTTTFATAADFLPGVKHILFLGDSITYAGNYVDQFDAFLEVQFPNR